MRGLLSGVYTYNYTPNHEHCQVENGVFEIIRIEVSQKNKGVK